MYNQPTKVMPDGRHVGLLYKNPIDCLWKTLKTEGPFGWYKGEEIVGFCCPTCLTRPSRFHGAFPAHSASYVRLTYFQQQSITQVLSRIITLTANDMIINLYKRFMFGVHEDDD